MRFSYKTEIINTFLYKSFVLYATRVMSVGGDVSGDGVSSPGNYIMAARDGWAGAQLKRVSSHKD